MSVFLEVSNVFSPKFPCDKLLPGKFPLENSLLENFLLHVNWSR